MDLLCLWALPTKIIENIGHWFLFQVFKKMGFNSYFVGHIIFDIFIVLFCGYVWLLLVTYGSYKLHLSWFQTGSGTALKFNNFNCCFSDSFSFASSLKLLQFRVFLITASNLFKIGYTCSFFQTVDSIKDYLAGTLY
jgi:hypothetical protein